MVINYHLIIYPVKTYEEENMTVKELMDALQEMPKSAKVVVVNPTLCGLKITKIKHQESIIYEEGVVEILVRMRR